MKSIPNIVAIVLIALGIILMSYAGFSYTKQEDVAQIGSLTITNEEKKTIPFSPTAGAICLGLGIIVLIVNRMKK